MGRSVSRRCRIVACNLVLAGPALPAQADLPLKIVTEGFLPYNMTQNGRVTGLATDVLQAVLKEVNMQGHIQSMPWARGPMKWRKARKPCSSTPSRARRHARNCSNGLASSRRPTGACSRCKAGTSRCTGSKRPSRARGPPSYQDVGEQFLVSRGFAIGQNLQSSAKYEFNYEKLKLGRVDLWVSNALVAAYLARQAGDDPTKVLHCAYPMAELSGDRNFMAFSLNTPDDLVARFHAGLEAIKKNGTPDALKRKWL